MKIAVISLKVNSNYGGILQAWALQQILIRLGHEPVLIDTASPADISFIRKSYLYPIRLINKVFFHATKPIRHEAMETMDWNRSMHGVSSFINNINIRTIKNISEIKETDYDGIIYGSDQVWRPGYFRHFLGNMRNAFGWFARDWENIKIYSYAASFGIDTLDEYTAEELADIRRVIKRFSKISVREKSGIRLCQELGTEATHVLDPTMLLDSTDYLQLIDESKLHIKKRRGIMTYILDPSDKSEKIIEELSLLTGKHSFSTLAPIDSPSKSVEQWLAGFRDADFIVTDSFHACVFSIIFNKPFIVISNSTRGTARIDSLLEMFGLSQHKITTPTLPTNPISTYTLDKCFIHSKLQTLRNTSFAILNNIG